MSPARSGRREAFLDKPRKLLRHSIPIGGAISIRGSERSQACPMNGYLGAPIARHVIETYYAQKEGLPLPVIVPPPPPAPAAPARVTAVTGATH